MSATEFAAYCRRIRLANDPANPRAKSATNPTSSTATSRIRGRSDSWRRRNGSGAALAEVQFAAPGFSTPTSRGATSGGPQPRTYLVSWYDELNTLADVEGLITDGVRESETIDDKTAHHPIADHHYNDIAKDVSAFANSSGGIIIYGVDTKKDNDGTIPDKIVAIDPDNIQRIIRAVSNFVRHPVPGIRYKSIPRTGTPKLFLLDIPESPLAPHQSLRHKQYFRRHLDSAEPMTHDLVELYFGRRLGPWLEPELRDVRLVMATSATADYAAILHAKLWLRNIGAGTAREILVAGRVPDDSRSHLFTGNTSNSAEFANRRVRGNLVEIRAHPPILVIHPEDENQLHAFEFRVAENASASPQEPNTWIFDVSIMAANMRPRRFKGQVWWEDDREPTLRLEPVTRKPESKAPPSLPFLRFLRIVRGITGQIRAQARAISRPASIDVSEPPWPLCLTTTIPRTTTSGVFS